MEKRAVRRAFTEVRAPIAGFSLHKKKPGRPGQLPCLVGKPPFGKKNARAAYSKEDKMKRSLDTPLHHTTREGYTGRGFVSFAWIEMVWRG